MSTIMLPFTFFLVGSRRRRGTTAFVCLLLAFLVRLTHRNELQHQLHTAHRNITTTLLLLEKAAKLLRCAG